LNVQPAATNKITTIGAAARVVMIGAGTATITNMNGFLNTVQGSLGFQDQQVFCMTGNLAVPGTLEFLLEAADEGGTLSTGLNVNGNIDFTGASIDVTDLGDMIIGVYRLVEWTGTRTDTPTLGNLPDNGFEYALLVSGTNSGFVELSVAAAIPEPSSLLLCCCGALAMMRRRRR
jgi:hypothetical protein